MRHGKKGNHLKRKTGHRRALLKNMSNALIEHKRIFTTLAKAKALRVHLEPIISKSKINTTHSRRVAFSYLNSKEAVKELFSTIATAVADRPGGYLRVIKMGFRPSDGAEMAMIEFVDFNTTLTSFNTGSGETKSKKRSRRGGAKKKAIDTVASASTTAAATDVAASSEEE